MKHKISSKKKRRFRIHEKLVMNALLDYEIHVLRKHEEEIVLVKSEQKRKITVFQDSINKLVKLTTCFHEFSEYESTICFYQYFQLFYNHKENKLIGPKRLFFSVLTIWETQNKYYVIFVGNNWEIRIQKIRENMSWAW